MSESTAAELAYRNYLLAILTAILTFNYVDRLALGMVMQNIKADLDLTDSQLGLMSGLAFALFYSVMGVPLARWADHGNRITLIALTAALGSAMVMFTGAGQTFAQMLLIRIGAGIGESGCLPSAHSLIADHFSRHERPRAMARYMLGGPLSCLIGYWGAGYLNALLGWRWTFFVLGLPGLLFAAIARWSLLEPRLRSVSPPSVEMPGPVSGKSHQYGLREAATVLFRNRSFRHLVIALSVQAFFNLGAATWQPTFFIRSFGLATQTVGFWLALVFGLGGLLGVYIGGEWAARWARGNESLQLRTVAALQCAFGGVSILTYYAPSYELSFCWLSLGVIGATATTAPLFATLQSLVPERLRAFSVAVIFLFSNLIGLGLGPLAVGAVSDALHPWVMGDSLRLALLAMCPGYVWVAWHLWRASYSVHIDLASNSHV